MRFSFAVACLLAALASEASGQSETLTTGTRIRVTSPIHNLDQHVVTVGEIRGDSVVVNDRTGPHTIALANVTALDVSRGTRNRVARDGLIGLGVGAATGIALMAAADDGCDDAQFCIVPVSESQFAAAGALVLGAAGFLAGAVIGTFDRTEIWEPQNHGLKAALRSSRSQGVALSISRSF